MDSELFNFLTTQGIFALLFGYLLLYILKQNQIREENYQKIIQQLNVKYTFFNLLIALFLT